jgi:hypothetical protein
VKEVGGNCIMRSFITCTLLQVARMGEKRNTHRILVGKSEGPRHRWVDNIKIDLRETGRGDLDWIELNWLRIGTSGVLL